MASNCRFTDPSYTVSPSRDDDAPDDRGPDLYVRNDGRARRRREFRRQVGLFGGRKRPGHRDLHMAPPQVTLEHLPVGRRDGRKQLLATLVDHDLQEAQQHGGQDALQRPPQRRLLVAGRHSRRDKELVHHAVFHQRGHGGHAAAEGLDPFVPSRQLEEGLGVAAGDGVFPHVQAPPEPARSSM